MRWEMLSLPEWTVKILPEAEKDILLLDGSVRPQVLKAIAKVRQNPLPMAEGGYGKPLGNKSGTDLSGLLKVKLKASGIRIVYQIVRTQTTMTIIIVGARADDEVYIAAEKRRKKYGI